MYGRSTELFDQLSTDFMCLLSQKLLCYDRNRFLCLLIYTICLAHICSVSRLHVSVALSAVKMSFSLLQ